METQLINQDKLNQFTNTIASRIQKGFVIIEKNDKMPFIILMREEKKVNHMLNFVVFCITFGVWSLPWLYIAQVSSKAKKIVVAIDEEGNIFEENCYMG